MGRKSDGIKQSAAGAESVKAPDLARILAIARKYAAVPDVDITSQESRAVLSPEFLPESHPSPNAHDETNPIKPTENVHKCASMFLNVHQCASPHAHADYETKPTTHLLAPSPLTPRQVAAACLLALGRTGKAAAREIGVNAHTITRWRRQQAFREELAQQHRLVAMLQLNERR